MEQVLLGLFYVVFPAVIIYLCEKVPFLEKMGPVVLAYLIGFTLGNIKFLPEGSESVQSLVATLTIPLAIPLLLFSVDVKKWTKVAGKALISMVIAIAAVVVIIIVGNTWFSGQIADVWKVSGMLVGVYTGGTPNLAAIKTALNVDSNVYIIVHTYDTLLSTVYIIFFITIARKLFLTILPEFHFTNENGIGKAGPDHIEDVHPYAGMFARGKFFHLMKAFLFSIGIFAIAGGLSLLVSPNSSMAVAILTITTLGIGLSLVPSINKIDKTFQLGMYLILIFCLDVASMANIHKIAGTSPDLFFFVFLAIFGSLFLHVLISSFFKIDADTVIITSTAMICSPPFVPVVASALKNKEIIVTGLTTGVIGYAIGNYLGIFLAYLLR